jgi:hypothetical protein
MCIDGEDHDWVSFVIILPDGGSAPGMRCAKCGAELYA